MTDLTDYARLVAADHGLVQASVVNTGVLEHRGHQVVGFTTAGARKLANTHDDWATYDRVMAEERRAAVLMSPVCVYG